MIIIRLRYLGIKISYQRKILRRRLLDLIFGNSFSQGVIRDFRMMRRDSIQFIEI